MSEVLALQQEVKGQIDANRASLTALAADIATEKQTVAAIAPGLQAQFTADQAMRVTEFNATQVARQAEYTAKAAEYQTSFLAAQAERQEKYVAATTENQAQFTAAQQARAKEHADAHQDRQEKSAALLAEYTKSLAEQSALFIEERSRAVKRSDEQLATLKTDYEQSAKTILDAIVACKVEVEKLVGVIGNLGVTSGYLKTANHARTAMYIWQGLTVASLSALIYFAYLISFGAPPVQETAFYQGLATRIFLSITVGVFAAYAARQGDKASIAERKNRKLALELEALGPYIAPLPSEMQDKFRVDLGERSFGVPDGEGQKAADSSPSPATLLDVLNSKEGKALLLEVVKVAQTSKV